MLSDFLALSSKERNIDKDNMITIYLNLISNESERDHFLKLYNKYKNLMHFVARNITKDDWLAEDAVQEAFIRVAKSFHIIENMDDTHTKNLLAIIAKNEAISIVRKESRHRNELLSESDLNVGNTADTTFEETSFLEIKKRILSMPEHYRNLIYLIGVCELDLKEAARLLNISYETAKKRLQRSRRLIKESINAKEGGHR